MAKKRERVQKPKEAGPMDMCVMVCKDCGHPEFGPVYQIVWASADHPNNSTGKDIFQPSFFKYACLKCGCVEAVLPPGFEEMRAKGKTLANPMRLVSDRKKEEKANSATG